MLSTFDMFKIGIGPSSSHTVGPMRIARRIVKDAAPLMERVTACIVELQGSLALTGVGHGSDKAAILGLIGAEPETIDPDWADQTFEAVKREKKLTLSGGPEIDFDPTINIEMRGDIMPKLHPNGMGVRFYDKAGAVILERVFYSTGGGFIASAEQLTRPAENDLIVKASQGGMAFSSGAELLAHCVKHDLSIADIVLANEDAKRPRPETDAGLAQIWDAMAGSIDRGLRTKGVLPGGLHVTRRAPGLYAELTQNLHNAELERLFDWLNVYAMAVNEENAAGGRVVTAPTNGAAGVIPALIRYYCLPPYAEGAYGKGDRPSEPVRGAPEQSLGAIEKKYDGRREDRVDSASRIGRFLLTAAGIGLIYKQRASLSGAEMGCQGEVGVACSMGAAGLCAVWGGTPPQVEHAAEIAMEHNLGLTCDPVGGLVQIPCIERNAIGAVKAANAARLALKGDGKHKVSLDQVIETMRQTGLDMSSKYKETSQGGLAVNVVEC